MDINQYLHQFRELKTREDRLYQKVNRKESSFVGSASNFGDGIPTRSSENKTEKKLVELADLKREYKEAHNDYVNFREELRNHCYCLTYQQGAILLQVYINNVIFGAENDLRGVDEILETKSRRKIISALTDAKRALRARLIDQGVDIEDIKDNDE